MVLLSCKTQTPLAALTLKADDEGCLSMLTARPPPKGASEAYFQGMLNQVDESFTLTISNLSDEGMINFDVLHTPCLASQVNPGPDYAINKTSVISPNQSYTFEADQRNICRMVLGGKTKQARFPLLTREKNIPMTVKEAEAKAMGLDFYLNVVAEKDCKSLVNKFAEGTAWKVIPGFVRRVTVAAAMVMPTDRIAPPSFSLQERVPLRGGDVSSSEDEELRGGDVSSSEEEESELLPREEDMEAAADIVIQAKRIRLTRQEIVVAGDVSYSEEEESELLLPREEDMEAAADMTEVYDNFAEELDSIPLSVASLAREGSTMTVEALEERFKQITEILVSLEQRQKEFQTESQQRSNSSPITSGQYSEALEQQFKQITDTLTCMQQQQVEAFRRYEEAQPMKQHRPSFDEPSERTTSVASSFEHESSQDLSALSMNTCRPGDQSVSSRSSIDPSGSFYYFRNSLQREELRRDLPKPDPPAIQVLVEDVLEKLDPDGKIQTNEADSNLPQERLTPFHSVRRILEGEKSESTLDRKLPAWNAVQERPASAQSRQTTDSEEAHGDESQRNRKLPPSYTSKETSASDRSQRVVDTGIEESPKPPVREPVSTQSFPDESPMRIIQNDGLRVHESNVETQSNDQDTWETRPDTRVGAIPVKEIKLNIMAPPGHLGVTFAEDTEPPTVGAIKKSSPIFGSLEVGDELLKVNDDDVRWMSSAMISALLSCREDEYRELGIQRAVRFGAENRPVNRQILRRMIGRQAELSSESNTETSKSETPEDSRERYRAEVETLVHLLVPEEIDNVDVMMDWFSGREADLVSTLRTMQEKSMAQRERSEENESTSSSDKAPRRDSPPEKREADTRAASETIGREPPGTTPLQPHSIQRNDPRLSRWEPGAIRVGGVYPSEDDPTVEVGGSTASQELISAELLSGDAELTQLTEAVATMIQRQRQELLDANRNGGGPSCRDRFEMFTAQTAPRFRRGRRFKPQKTKRNKTKNILTAATRLWRGRRSKPLDSSLAVKVSSTQAAELKHGYKVQSLGDEETPQVSSGRTIEFDCEHHSEPAVLSMSIWKGMKFQVVSNVELQIAESVLTLVKNEGKALIRSSNEIVKAECCIIDGKSKVDTIVCTCGHQCLNHKNVADVYRCPICSSPVTAFVQSDGLIIE
jgi:hypothetical protein